METIGKSMLIGKENEKRMSDGISNPATAKSWLSVHEDVHWLSDLDVSGP
jgi:hypothetical protein